MTTVEAEEERVQLEQALAKLKEELERLSRQQQVPHFYRFLLLKMMKER